MPLLAGVTRVILQAIQGFVSGLRWLARQAYRQRSLGVASNPQLTRLLDVHFVTVAAHLALFAALIVAEPSLTAKDWLLFLPLLVVLIAVAIWRPTRLAVILLIAAQLVVCLVAVLWARQGILLAMLLAFALAQQAALIRGARAMLGRATAAGLLLGVFTGGGGLLVGIFTPAFPLWICALLLVVALVLTLRMPKPPAPPKLPSQHVPRVPEGYTVYRPSSLDDSR